MSKSRLIFRLAKRIFHTLPFIILVAVGVPIVGMAGNEMSKILGLKPVPVPVVGTGSMYPSLFWSTSEGGPEDESKKIVEEYRNTPHLYRRFRGVTLFGQTFGLRRVGQGDMVAFQNAQTAAILAEEGKNTDAGFIKRVIGVPGDTIELRDGFVYRNEVLLKEPYIALARSTYGGDSLQDCVKLSLGPGKYFVLGDNRKVSSDSRFELGLIDESDIEYVLPYPQQSIYVSLYRDTSKDAELLGEPSLASREFVNLLNAKRQSAGVAQLSLSAGLAKSSTLRGEKLLQDPNTSYGMQQAVRSAGYSNIILGEFVSYGHFSAQELLENLLFNTNTAKQVLNSEYSDLGISAVNREVNGCPSQVIVGHLGGYVPADYSEDNIGSWRRLRDNLLEVIPSWERAVGDERVNQGDLSQLLTILRRRLSLAQEIVGTMEKKEWLSASQESRIQSDNQDAEAAETLARLLNGE